MFSRISHWKGQKYFIEAINLLKDNPEFENMEFWIIGDAIMGTEEEKYKKYIIELINNYDLSDNIKLFGFIENPIEYMQNIDILVLPSIYPEPFGRVIVEAMLLNKVVIATNMGGAKEIIEHNNSGFLVETNKLEHHLKNYFLILYHNKELYNKLSENGYKTALKYFTEDIMIKNIDNIIKGLK
jgi:glycosyltransferase involved in cell wall biosynthesis